MENTHTLNVKKLPKKLPLLIGGTKNFQTKCFTKGVTSGEIMSKKRYQYVPVTPGGTPCTWLASPTEEEAWQKLMQDAAHMPYRNKQEFIERGYTVEKWPGNDFLQ